MANIFANNSYRTGLFGKWHLGDNYPYRPIDRGFHETVNHKCGGVGQISDWWGNDYFDDTYYRNEKPEKFTGYCNDNWFEEALKFIEKNRDRPFFCYIPTNIPHGPFYVADKYKIPFLEMGIDENRAAFYGMIRNLDENMGRLLGKLDELNLAQNTILIFMTDNGTARGFEPVQIDGWPEKGFNAGMRGKKASHYEGGHRVPCFIRWPNGGLDKPKNVDALCAHFDLLPTLIDLCGLERSKQVEFDGRVLTPLLRGEQKDWIDDRLIFVQLQGGAYFRYQPNPDSESATLSKRWRLVDKKKLYDIQKDPAQKKNIADFYPQVVDELNKAYEAWFADVASGLNNPCPIVIGSDFENPMILTSQDWILPVGNPPWNQSHVRGGNMDNGFWLVEIAQDGIYEFTLRRWPQEINTPIIAAIDGGKALSATNARIRIGNIENTEKISAGATNVTFRISLVKGKSQLQTWFVDELTNKSFGAYYVTVKRLLGV
jgi:arylsulfatase A-like enzyme